jgi:hypothetical protein
METRVLPEQFSDLQPFVDDWALTTEVDRFRKLHSVSVEELRPFYQAMLPRMDGVLAFLDQFRVGAMPPDVLTLFDLAMTFSETAHPLDLKWTDVDFTDAYPWQKFEFRTVSLDVQQ